MRERALVELPAVVTEWTLTRACRYVALAYFACAGGLEIYAALHCPLPYTADFLYDDAYYYAGLACGITPMNLDSARR